MLHIPHPHVREDQIALVGFLDVQGATAIFEEAATDQRHRPKACDSRVLSGNQLRSNGYAISSGDNGTRSRGIPGIGKKERSESVSH